MPKIRYHGHNCAYKTRRPENDLYKSVLDLLKFDELFTSIGYDKFEEEFSYEWRFHIKKELELHISVIEYDTHEINAHNMVKLYNTNLCNGEVFIKSIIVPKINITKNDGRLKKNERFDFQMNLEVGKYTDDGYYSFVFENLYMTEN